MEEWLRKSGHKVGKHDNRRGDTAQHAIPELYEKWGPFDYKFTIVRHPMHRFLSMLGFWILRSPPYLPLRQQYKTADKLARVALRSFKKERFAWHNHLRPQSDFISPGTEVIKFENGIFRVLREIFEIPVPFPHLQRSRSPIPVTALSNEVREEVLEIYAKDIAEFDYA